jgi:hypothetical protein
VSSKIDEIAAELTGSFVTKLQEQIAKQVPQLIPQADPGLFLPTTVILQFNPAPASPEYGLMNGPLRQIQQAP